MIKKILFTLLIPFLFLSCEELFLDMNGVTCSLDKKTYTKEENIVLNCAGSFPNENTEGYLTLRFGIFKLVNGSREGNKVVFEVVDCGELSYDKNNENNSFFAYLIKNTRMHSFNEKISIKMDDVGEYELLVEFNGTSAKNRYDNVKFFSLFFNVTE